jgi:hypothetical protein
LVGGAGVLLCLAQASMGVRRSQRPHADDVLRTLVGADNALPILDENGGIFEVLTQTATEKPLYGFSGSGTNGS